MYIFQHGGQMLASDCVGWKECAGNAELQLLLPPTQTSVAPPAVLRKPVSLPMIDEQDFEDRCLCPGLRFTVMCFTVKVKHLCAELQTRNLAFHAGRLMRGCRGLWAIGQHRQIQFSMFALVLRAWSRCII